MSLTVTASGAREETALVERDGRLVAERCFVLLHPQPPVQPRDRVAFIDDRPAGSDAADRLSAAAGRTLKLRVDRVVTASVVAKQRATATAAGQPAPPTGEAQKEGPLTVDIACEEGEQWGVQLDSRLAVTHVRSGGACDGALHVGDKIESLNGRRLASASEAFCLMQQSWPLARLVVRRGGGTQTAPTQKTDAANEVTVSVPMEEGEPVGVHPDEKLMLTRVQEGAVGHAHFQVGDIIKKVDGVPVTSQDHFYKLMENAASRAGIARVALERSGERTAEQQFKQLPPNLEKMIERHSGYEYAALDVRFDVESGRHFGLELANCAHNNVIVTALKDNCVAGDFFKLYDRLLAVNGQPVSSEQVARSAIVDKGGNFQALVERPRTAERLQERRQQHTQWRSAAVAARSGDAAPPADDVREIVLAELRRRRAAPVTPPPKSILLRADPARRPASPLSFREKPTEHSIQSDVPADKVLRSVPSS